MDKGYVNRTNDKGKAKKGFSIQPEESRLRDRPKCRWWDCEQADVFKCNTRKWRQI